MKYSLCIELFYKYLDFEKKIPRAALDGFEYVEFWRWADRNWNSLASTLKNSGTKVSAFSGDDEFSMINSREKSLYLKYLQDSITKALAVKCKNLVIHSDALDPNTGSAKEISKELSFESKLINMYEVLKSAAPMAEAAGITLVIEPLNIFVDHRNYFLSDPDLAFDIVRQVGSEQIKVLYDIYHMQIMGGNIIKTLEKNLEQVGYIHVADVPGRHEPGTGELNYRNIFKSLETAGYEGFIGFELSPSADDESAVESIKRSLV